MRKEVSIEGEAPVQVSVKDVAWGILSGYSAQPRRILLKGVSVLSPWERQPSPDFRVYQTWFMIRQGVTN